MTDTTREGFPEWWRNAARQCDYGRVLLPTHHEAYIAGQQAAKADELAFLEGLLDTYNDECWDAHDAIEIMGSSINNRIAHLKGEK